mgnify:FL=1
MVAARTDRESKRRAGRRAAAAPAAGLAAGADGASPLQRAFFQRAMSGLTRFAAGGDDALAAALRAPTDVGTLAYVASELAASTAVAELDPTAALLAEGARAKQEVLERAGGVFGVNDVARILRISRQAVDKRRRAGRLLAVRQGQGYAYPVAQFVESGIVPGLERALAAMPIEDPWMRLEWLVTEDDALDGASPLMALKAGRADDVIVSAAGHGA